MGSFMCEVCGYIYDPEKGEPDVGIIPGIEFDRLQEDFTCPWCGAMKSNFQSLSDM
jgi:rubredoxin